jgi:D-aspartate ligase
MLDTSVPALLVKVGPYPVHHGALGAMRSLGRLGVPVYALTGRRFTPAVRSRYLTGRFDWPETGDESPADLVALLLRTAERIGGPIVPVATDDEAAILLAEHAAQLSGPYLLPGVPPELPRRLNSKLGLFEVCTALGIDTPRTIFPTRPDELAEAGRELGYPLIAKNITADGKRTSRFVVGTILVRSETELLRQLSPHADLTGLLLQEYVPIERGEDWFVHIYADAEGQCLANIACRKMRSWPPGRGWTGYAVTEDNPAISGATATLAKALGWRGIANLDFRYDQRDKRYKLLDFNPRMGAQFRSAQTEAGIDMVRALHLYLTGRPVPPAPADTSRRMFIETNDVKARIAYRWQKIPVPEVARRPNTTYAWWAADDPVPYAFMLARSAFGTLARSWRRQDKP